MSTLKLQNLLEKEIGKAKGLERDWEGYPSKWGGPNRNGKERGW